MRVLKVNVHRYRSPHTYGSYIPGTWYLVYNCGAYNMSTSSACITTSSRLRPSASGQQLTQRKNLHWLVGPDCLPSPTGTRYDGATAFQIVPVSYVCDRKLISGK